MFGAEWGDEVEIMAECTNLSGSLVDDLMVRFVLPYGLEYVQGSTVLYNSNHPDGAAVAEDTAPTSGINIGSYADGGNCYVCLRARVVNAGGFAGPVDAYTWCQFCVGTDLNCDYSVMRIGSE